MNPTEHIEALRKEAAVKLADAERIARLTTQYPDLRRHVNRWNTVTFCSASVNSTATHYHQHHNCGCCNDSPLEVWPYIQTPDGEIHSDPPCFRIGEKSGCYDEPYYGWEQQLRTASIPEDIISKIQGYFAECESALAEERDEEDET